MTPSTVRPAYTAARWLTQESATRSSVFALGFGLGMDTEDVSEFLTKVINEEDFNFDDAEEVIYWYCYHFHLPYAKARVYKQDYDLIIVKDDEDTKMQPLDWEQISSAPDFKIHGEAYLKSYLSLIKKNNPKDQKQKIRYQEFVQLYHEACAQVADCYNQEEKDNKHWSAEEVGPADLERFLCCGIPLTKNGNVKRRSSSLLTKHFSAKRMTRQVFDAVFSGRVKVHRFDLISLHFLVSAIRDVDMEPENRLSLFIEETNAILNHCHMRGLYSANAYECFLLLCLLSEEPLAFYSDVLEYTYDPGLLSE